MWCFPSFEEVNWSSPVPKSANIFSDSSNRCCEKRTKAYRFRICCIRLFFSCSGSFVMFCHCRQQCTCKLGPQINTAKACCFSVLMSWQSFEQQLQQFEGRKVNVRFGKIWVPLSAAPVRTPWSAVVVWFVLWWALLPVSTRSTWMPRTLGCCKKTSSDDFCEVSLNPKNGTDDPWQYSPALTDESWFGQFYTLYE